MASSAVQVFQTAQIFSGPSCKNPSRVCGTARFSPVRCLRVCPQSVQVQPTGACFRGSQQNGVYQKVLYLGGSSLLDCQHGLPTQARQLQRVAERRSILVRASGDVETGDLDARREELKSKLRKSLEGNTGNLTEEELGLIDELAKLNPDPEPAKNLNLVKGGFRLLNSTTPGVLYKGAKLTLGRGSFWMFPPSEMMMTLHDVYNEVNEADGRQYYDIYEDVTLEPEGLPTLNAKIYNKAVYTLEGDKRVAVEFTESILSPAEGTDLEVWKKVFKENPDIQEDGTMRKVFPKGKPGWLDIIYQDKSFRITKGNLGNTVVVERDP